MQHFKRTDVAHPLHMQFIKTHQLFQQTFPLSAVQTAVLNILEITGHVEAPPGAFSFAQLQIRAAQAGLERSAQHIEIPFTFTEIILWIKTQVSCKLEHKNDVKVG